MPGQGASDFSKMEQPESDGSTSPLFSAVYDQLRTLAHAQLSHERSGLTLQTTALVHEVYLRMMKDPQVKWESSRHFFGAAAESMRRILVERARRYAAVKHGGGRARTDLEAADANGELAYQDTSESAAAMLALNEAIADLKQKDETAAEVVMLRYFAGLSVDETAAALGRSPRSVKSDWSFARQWLAKRLEAFDNVAAAS